MSDAPGLTPRLSTVALHRAKAPNPLEKDREMKVKIDYGLCMGDGHCHKVCPEVFDYDDDKLRGVVRLETVPKHLEDKVRQAAEECVPKAIEIED